MEIGDLLFDLLTFESTDDVIANGMDINNWWHTIIKDNLNYFLLSKMDFLLNTRCDMTEWLLR